MGQYNKSPLISHSGHCGLWTWFAWYWLDDKVYYTSLFCNPPICTHQEEGWRVRIGVEEKGGNWERGLQRRTDWSIEVAHRVDSIQLIHDDNWVEGTGRHSSPNVQQPSHLYLGRGRKTHMNMHIVYGFVTSSAWIWKPDACFLTHTVDSNFWILPLWHRLICGNRFG